MEIILSHICWCFLHLTSHKENSPHSTNKQKNTPHSLLFSFSFLIFFFVFHIFFLKNHLQCQGQCFDYYYSAFIIPLCRTVYVTLIEVQITFTQCNFFIKLQKTEEKITDEKLLFLLIKKQLTM